MLSDLLYLYPRNYNTAVILSTFEIDTYNVLKCKLILYNYE